MVLLRILKRYHTKIILNKDYFSKTPSQPTNDVIIHNYKDKGLITLNRPKALNALSLNMLKKILPALKRWETEKNLVIIKSSDEKVFCAGGDVVEITTNGITTALDYYQTEYNLIHTLGTYRVPCVALINGLVMGFGAGLSVHGKYRIATEKTAFAMPELKIGYFPDVGASYFLPRLKGKLGFYLGLTGFYLKGSDVLKSGIATHLCRSENLLLLERELLQCKNDHDIKETLNRFSFTEKTKSIVCESMLDKINKCFGHGSIEEIMEELSKDKSEWAQQTLQAMESLSPTSLKVSLKELQLGSQLEFKQCLMMEFKIAIACLKHRDYKEGVRAYLIDKDGRPKWQPSTLKQVSEELVDSHFSDIIEELKL